MEDAGKGVEQVSAIGQRQKSNMRLHRKSVKLSKQ